MWIKQGAINNIMQSLNKNGHQGRGGYRGGRGGRGGGDYHGGKGGGDYQGGRGVYRGGSRGGY